MLNYKKEMNIENICQEYDIQNYTINSDGTVDVDGIVDLSRRNLSKLPLKFGRVTGSFYCGNNQLTSLEGCPNEVVGSFDCCLNQLTTLEGCPKVVGGNFNCKNNPLPQEIMDNPKSFIKQINRDILINELIDEY
jgi:hypothetical protein